MQSELILDRLARPTRNQTKYGRGLAFGVMAARKMGNHHGLLVIAHIICCPFQHHLERVVLSHPMTYQRPAPFPLDSLGRMINRMFWEWGYPFIMNYFLSDKFIKSFSINPWVHSQSKVSWDLERLERDRQRGWMEI